MSNGNVMSRRNLIGQMLIPVMAMALANSAIFPSPAMAQQASPNDMDPARASSPPLASSRLQGNDPNLGGARTFNIRDFGAKGDGKTLDTPALQAAIDAATADGGGTVLVPAGVFPIGSTEMKANVTLHLAAGAKLLGIADGTQYHASSIPLNGDTTLNDGNVGLLYGVNAENITIEGPGTIDGQGSQFRSPAAGQPAPAGITGARRPHMMLFYRCNNLKVRNITMLNSAFHTLRVIQSSYCLFDSIHMHCRVISNNDGFHFISAQFVNISNCVIQTQDDACALFGSCQHIMVTNSAFSTRWSVFRFGGGEVNDVLVSNCLLYQVYGCPVKAQMGGNSRLENVTFSNIVMDDVTGPIHIGFAGGGGGRGGRAGTRRGATRGAALPLGEPAANPPAAPANNRGVVRNISFNGIRASVPSKPPQLPDVAFPSAARPGEMKSTIVLNGVNGAILENITFDDVQITYGGGGTTEEAANRAVPQTAGEYFELGVLPAYGMFARNVHGLTLNNCRFRVAEADLRPAVILDHVEDAAIAGLNIDGNPQAESVLRFIESKQALLTATRVLTPSSVLLRVEGAGSDGIIIDGGDLTKAATPLAFADGAKESAVRMRV